MTVKLGLLRKGEVKDSSLDPGETYESAAVNSVRIMKGK